MEATAHTAAETPPSNAEGISTAGTLRRISETVLSILHNRLELLTTELKVEKHWAVGTLVLAVLAAGLAFTSIIAILVTVAFLAPPEARKWVMLGICAVSIGGLLYSVMSLRAKFKRPAMLHDTLAELKKDIECLKEN
jgi:uncharacterized membrane protein YqjE